jgi:3-phenylpropionate/cinnamic acid dioxygenase small subunit
MMTADGASKAEVADLFDRYVTYLDERQYQDWLDLFTEDARYVMLLREDYVKDTNMLAIGEGKRELAGRIEVGQGVERDPRTHLLTAVILEKSTTGTRGAANFALLRHGAVACSGRYHMDLVRRDGALRIERCVCVINDAVVRGTIYLPV